MRRFATAMESLHKDLGPSQLLSASLAAAAVLFAACDGSGSPAADAAVSNDGLIDGGPESWDAGPAPQWFKDAAEGEWTAVAGASNQILHAVVPSPVPDVPA